MLIAIKVKKRGNYSDLSKYADLIQSLNRNSKVKNCPDRQLIDLFLLFIGQKNEKDINLKDLTLLAHFSAWALLSVPQHIISLLLG